MKKKNELKSKMGKVKRNRKSTAFLENLVICFFFTAPEASLGLY